MTTAVQHRRGTTAEHSTFTGLEGEVTIDTTKDTAVIHDGSLAGGYPLAKETLANVNPSTLSAITGAATASDDLFLMYDTSALAMKKISRAELNNAITIEALDTVDINGGTIDGTAIGGTTPAAGSFTTLSATGNVTVGGTVDGRDVAADGSKLDGIEAGADVTDTANVTAAGALMDSELTNITAVKALNQGVATTDQPTWNGVDLAAISASISATAVDVFVYDTRKDSDGGAWRKRTQHTSWYNETLNTTYRGSRKEFPAVAVLVVNQDNIWIYDGDDPDLPLWMHFTRTTNNIVDMNGGRYIYSVSMLNGKLTWGSSVGVKYVDFIADYAGTMGSSWDEYRFNTNIAERHSSTQSWYSVSTLRIVNNTVNDVAMTVLPNAPIDAATGLPIPTIAVATNGGVSVIKDDGTVVDITAGAAIKRVGFSIDNLLAVCYASYGIRIGDIPISDIADSNFGEQFRGINESEPSVPKLQYSGTNDSAFAEPNFAYASQYGISLLEPDIEGSTGAASLTGMVNYITSSYQSGWMNGDIKGAWLSDTDATNVTGAELVTNGTFDTDTSGWGAVTATLSVVSNRLRITNSGANYGYAWQSFSTEVGKTYVYSLDYTKGTSASASMRVGTAQGGSQLGAKTLSASGSHSVTFTATTTTTYILVINLYNSDGIYTDIDNISVRLADADRSVNNNGLQVFGTVTKTPVATGADLVAYSGFSASNYLEQPYNSDLDFGTGDFCVMGWVKPDSSIGNYPAIISRNVTANTESTAWALKFDKGGNNYYFFSNTSTIFTSTAGINYGSWVFLVATRKNGVLYFYINGKLETSGVMTHSITSVGATLKFGVDATYGIGSSQAALWRISATAPTAEQIAKIYEDEKVLFQEGAQATLYGSSDAVTALAYDDDTNLLHVGTSAGRSDFQGLRRVNNTTTAVGAAISASNGMIVEE